MDATSDHSGRFHGKKKSVSESKIHCDTRVTHVKETEQCLAVHISSAHYAYWVADARRTDMFKMRIENMRDEMKQKKCTQSNRINNQ